MTGDGGSQEQVAVHRTHMHRLPAAREGQAVQVEQVNVAAADESCVLLSIF